MAMAMILTSEEEQSRNSIIKPKRCNSNSSISIDDLTDGLLVEILQRVPCISVFRCKSVSKRWLALISDPYFTHRYRTNKKWQPRKFVLDIYLREVLITSQHPELRFPLNLSFLPCSQTPQVVGSSNGLLLCCTYTTDQTIYYVCNPLTKQWTVLPPAPRFKNYPMQIGFISYLSHNNSHCSFKVVRLICFLVRKCVFKGYTFSSETGQWKDLLLSCPRGFCMTSMSSIAIAYNGMLHWVMHRDKKIFVYDPANDKFHAIIDGPKDVHPTRFLKNFGLWRGQMRIAQLQDHNFPEYYNLKVWELKGYTTGEWQLVHQINLKELTWKDNISPPLPNAMSIIPCTFLAFHPYEDVIYLKFKDLVVSCDLQTKTLKFTDKLQFTNLSWAFVYTLVLPPWPTPVPALPHDALLQ